MNHRLQLMNTSRTMLAACFTGLLALLNTFDAETWILATFPGFGSPGILTATFQRKPSFSAVSMALGGRG